MSLSPAKKRRDPPLSLRLTPDERQQLVQRAGSMPLGSYIKSVVFASEAPTYRKRRKPPVAEQQLLAEVLARLGQSRTANNLNQIAKHLNQGTSVIDEELEADLKTAIAEVAWMRVQLLNALKGSS